jgi:hypothetical protein
MPSEAAREKILNPEPGSALARARDYGIDLTLLLENLLLTPQERLEKVVRNQALLKTLREAETKRADA